MTWDSIRKAIIWTRNNLDVIALVAVAWVIIGAGLGSQLEQRLPTVLAYPLGYAAGAEALGLALLVAYLL